MLTIRSVSGGVSFAFLAALCAAPAWAGSGQDGIQLQVTKGPAVGNVSLQWTGGLTPYSVFRSTTALDVTTPLSFLGTTPNTTWVDTPPPGGLVFYYIEGSCSYSPPEICDGLDNDCDASTPDGSQDPQFGAPCDGPDLDLCAEGTNACVSGGLSCSDNTLTNVEECAGNGADEDCDGSVDEGFNINGNPVCETSYALLGTLSGDLGSGSLVAQGSGERWLRLNLTENSSAPIPVSATMTLWSPEGTDFDIYVRCLGCSGNTGSVGVQHSMNGHIDVAFARRNDDEERVDSLTLLIEIRNFASNYCGYWQLYVTGNTGGPYANCFDPPF